MHASASAAQLPWWEQLTIVVCSSPVPSNPSTVTLQRAFASFALVPDLPRAHKLLHLDGPQPALPRKRRDAYSEFVSRVRELARNDAAFRRSRVVLSERFLFAAHNLAAAVRLVETQFMLVTQHDFVLVRPFDAPNLLRTMREARIVKHVRLNARPNVASGFDTVVENYTCAKCHVALARTCGWSDGPHVASRDYYLRVVVPRNQQDLDGGRHKFMEESMHYGMLKAHAEGGCWAARSAVARGEPPAWPPEWRKFGTFLYGIASAADGSYMKHRSLRGRVPQWGLPDPATPRGADDALRKAAKAKAATGGILSKVNRTYR